MRLLLSDVLSKETMENLERYVDLVTKASSHFTEAVKLLNEVKISDAQTSFYNVVRLLNESGKYKALAEDSMVSLRLDPGFKEELLDVINMLDDVGDLVKEASREFTILPFLEIPLQLRAGLVKLSKTVSEIVSKLSDAITSLIKGDYGRVSLLFKEILALEELADSIELENRAMILTFSDRLKPYALHLLVHDLNALLENTADMCARSIRRINLVIVAWLS
ncbi:MAG: DUF47 family protein [Desulfurococcaceae archaeon]